MYHKVRLPVDEWLSQSFGKGDLLFWIRTTYAPLTEEPAKIWPLAIPILRRSLTRQNLALAKVGWLGSNAFIS